MNWDRMEATWDQQKGIAEHHWMDIKNDELANVEGKREEFVERLQERFGITKAVAREQIEEFKENVDKPEKPNANLMRLHKSTDRRDKMSSRIPSNAKSSAR